MGPGGDEEVVAEEEALPDRLPLPRLPRHAQPAPGTRPWLLGQHLNTGHNIQTSTSKQNFGNKAAENKGRGSPLNE